MRVLVVLMCFLAGCLAQKPHPCRSPPLLSGSLTVSTQNEKLWAFAKYLYDGLGERIRLRELVNYKNKTFTYDVLLLFRESTMYEISERNRTCKKRPLKTDFQPWAVPKDASLLGQAVVGSSSGPGQGLLVNSWTGHLPNATGIYTTTVTEFGCIPVNTNYQTSQYGWVVTSFFNNIIGISEPDLLNPPGFCPSKDMEDSEVEAADFINLFKTRRREVDLNMRVLVFLLACLTAGCLAQRPKQCTSPPLLSGSLSVTSANGKLMAYARYSYDALGKRIRLREFGSYNNKTFHLDALLLYRQGVMYRLNYRNRTCVKKPLCVDFHPLAIPQNATLLGQLVLGSSSGPGQGVLVNSWTGEMHLKKGTAKYMNTVTEFGCIPISTLFHTDKSGWMVTSFFNNVIGLVDPQQFIPPSFCQDAELEQEDGEDPVTFFSLF
ncbi:uncharacterized protein LOC125009017 [Mugil cephalus]|uniref:uncharacterized protein LOC125009017 n=1 Tax=Mugil cephalus TaxID=48193 RepID=UPI001FB68AA0|nr:uncharacterized protein LOC125009017 [Mugil cephalus]